MGLAGISAIAARSIGINIGEPSQASLPDQCPISIFVCAVRLPAGCKAPFQLTSRLGAGASLDAATARSLCMLEGIERYCLQFREGDPASLRSTALAGTEIVVAPIERLRLGCNTCQGGTPTDSRGCSVGADLADAALRGLLELCERDAVDLWRDQPDQFIEVDASQVLGLEHLLAWLERSGFDVRFFEHQHLSGSKVYVCLTMAGGRAATGSACSLDARDAVIHACVESAVAWFNLAQIARNPARLHVLAPEDRAAVDAYLAPVERRDQPGLPAAVELGADCDRVEMKPDAAFESMARQWGGSIAVFDLSRPETGLVTARVTRDGA